MVFVSRFYVVKVKRFVEMVGSNTVLVPFYELRDSLDDSNIKCFITKREAEAVKRYHDKKETVKHNKRFLNK